MKVIRFAERNWRPDARTLISTGDYRIPLDMSEELAERAVREGAAVVVTERVETKPARRDRIAKKELANPSGMPAPDVKSLG